MGVIALLRIANTYEKGTSVISLKTKSNTITFKINQMAILFEIRFKLAFFLSKMSIQIFSSTFWQYDEKTKHLDPFQKFSQVQLTNFYYSKTFKMSY